MSTTYHLPVEPSYKWLPPSSRPEKLPQTLPLIYGRNPVGIAELFTLASGPCYVYQLPTDLEEKRNSRLVDARLCFEPIDPPLATGENVRAASVLIYDKNPLP